jgi:hypothetical protein
MDAASTTSTRFETASCSSPFEATIRSTSSTRRTMLPTVRPRCQTFVVSSPRPPGSPAAAVAGRGRRENPRACGCALARLTPGLTEALRRRLDARPARRGKGTVGGGPGAATARRGRGGASLPPLGGASLPPLRLVVDHDTPWRCSSWKSWPSRATISSGLEPARLEHLGHLLPVQHGARRARLPSSHRGDARAVRGAGQLRWRSRTSVRAAVRGRRSNLRL